MSRRSLTGKPDDGESPRRHLKFPVDMDLELHRLSGVLERTLSDLVREAIRRQTPRWQAMAEARQAMKMGGSKARPRLSEKVEKVEAP